MSFIKFLKQLRQISRRLQVLGSDNNPIEYQQRDRLLNRWDFLDYKVAKALREAKKYPLRIVT